MKKTAALVLALFTAPLAFANGGGYYDHGGTYDSLVPFEMEDIGAIAMETEDLRVEVGPAESVIHVRYTMRNTKDKKVRCRFGFPADIRGVGQKELNILPGQPERYEVNGKPIPFRCMKRVEKDVELGARRWCGSLRTATSIGW